MKKRLFSLLVAVSLVLGMIVMPAVAAVAGQTYETCPHCGLAWDQVNWQALLVEEPDKTIPSGHYYLEEDLTMSKRYKIGTSDGQTADLAVDVCLDLRGYKIQPKGSNDRAFYIYNFSRFDVLDSVGGGKVVGNCTSIGGSVYVCKDAHFYLHSGTVSNGKANHTESGGVIYGSAGSNIHIYGGIVDGSAVTGKEGETIRGGTIYVSGYMEMTDGLILGGTMYDGGSVALSKTGTLDMSGGIVAGGTATNSGGNLFSYSDVNISGGQILGGFASAYGGNIYSSYSSGSYIADLNISGGTIADGTAGSGGGNVACRGGTFTISGGTIKGNVYSSIVATITGNPVISNFDYEGMQGTKTVIFKDLTEGAKIVLRGKDDTVVATLAESPELETYLEKGYIVAASRYNLAMTENGLLSTLDNTGYCPHCKTEITWEPYSASVNTSGHYYVGSAVTVTAADAAATIANDADIVINLSNGSVKSEVPYQVAGKLTLLCTATSYASFSNTAETTENGGTINLAGTGTVTMYDGVLRGTTTTGKGGVIYADKGSTINIYGGRVEGGTAATGGVLYYYTESGTSKGKINISGGVIDGGTATGACGGLYIMRVTANITGGILRNGTAGTDGGILNSSSSGKFAISNALIYNGKAGEKGGIAYTASTSSEITVNSGIIYGGDAGTNGGNFYINNGRLKIQGGSVLNGTAGTSGGNIYGYTGYYYIKDGKDPNTNNNYVLIGDNDTTDANPAPVVSGGRAGTAAGNIWITGNLWLGKSDVVGGIAPTANTLYINSKAYITIKSGFDSKLNMYLQSDRIKQLNTNRYLSNTIVEDGAAGEIYAENYEMARLLYGQNGLQLGGASVVDAAGKQAWYLSAQEALQACGQDAYVKLYAPDNTLQIDTAAVVDLNGTNLTVTGSGKLYGFDSENDDYNGCGTATLGEATAEPVFAAPNGHRYVALTEGDKTSFHRMGITISNVSLRPGNAGIYFQGVWACDAILEEEITSYGVAVSVENMPGADFATDKDTLYTAFGKDTFVSGQAQTSVMVKNIIKAGADNATRGAMPIYAAPYAILKNGAVVTGVDNKTEGGVIYSMVDVLQTINRIWPRLTDSQQASVKKLYNLDATVMESWDLYNITAAINGTVPVRPLKILTLGHSLSLDAAHMLNLVAAAEGYDQEFIIGTLYHSGCKLTQHVEFLQTDATEYGLYISSTLTPEKPPVKEDGVTMKYGLEYTDWDIIIMQAGVFEIARESSYTSGNIQIIQNYVNEHKTNPNAIFAWNCPWVPPIDDTLRSKYPYSPNSYITGYDAFNQDRLVMYGATTDLLAKYIVTDNSFVYLIPSCTAIENANSSYLEEKDLYRDYVHMSDLGRVITSYTWYCTLMGIEHLDEVKLDAIPVAFFKSTTGTEDRVLTDAEKLIIIESVNNALANPLEMTQSQYTVAP